MQHRVRVTAARPTGTALRCSAHPVDPSPTPLSTAFIAVLCVSTWRCVHSPRTTHEVNPVRRWEMMSRAGARDQGGAIGFEPAAALTAASGSLLPIYGSVHLFDRRHSATTSPACVLLPCVLPLPLHLVRPPSAPAPGATPLRPFTWSDPTPPLHLVRPPSAPSPGATHEEDRVMPLKARPSAGASEEGGAAGAAAAAAAAWERGDGRMGE